MFEEKQVGGNTVNLSGIKALSKEARQSLALSIRKDPELWNTINGLGGLSIKSTKSRLQGTISDERQIITGAEIIISNHNNKKTTVKSNQYGYFSVDLVPDTYTVLISFGNDSSEEISVKTLPGITSTLNYDFADVTETV